MAISPPSCPSQVCGPLWRGGLACREKNGTVQHPGFSLLGHKEVAALATDVNAKARLVLDSLPWSVEVRNGDIRTFLRVQRDVAILALAMMTILPSGVVVVITANPLLVVVFCSMAHPLYLSVPVQHGRVLTSRRPGRGRTTGLWASCQHVGQRSGQIGNRLKVARSNNRDKFPALRAMKILPLRPHDHNITNLLGSRLSCQPSNEKPGSPTLGSQSKVGTVLCRTCGCWAGRSSSQGSRR
jgi:hypothetical protein